MKDRAHRKWQQVVIRSLCPPSSMNWEIFTMLMSLVYFTTSFQQNYFHLKGVWCVWGKLCKVRLTGLAAGSGFGEKLPMLIIGKAEKPQGFKGVKSLPCQHKSKKESWMIMREDLTRSSMLIIDKSPTHPNVNNPKAIELVFLPPNTTSQTQPMDQGVIRALKAFYRTNVVRRQIKYIDVVERPQRSTFLKPCACWSSYGTLYLQALWRVVLKRKASRRNFTSISQVTSINDEDEPFRLLEENVNELKSRGLVDRNLTVEDHIIINF